MPMRDYRCTECGDRREVFTWTSELETKCLKCGGKIEQVFSPFSIFIATKSGKRWASQRFHTKFANNLS